MDFADTEREATQVIDLVERQEAVEYQVKSVTNRMIQPSG